MNILMETELPTKAYPIEWKQECGLYNLSTEWLQYSKQYLVEEWDLSIGAKSTWDWLGTGLSGRQYSSTSTETKEFAINFVDEIAKMG